VKTRHFEFVAFWDQCGWVAGVTDYNCVAQGQTLARAVENLKYSLQVDAQFALNEGKQPFVIDYDGKLSLDSFARSAGAQPMPRGREEPKKGTRYAATSTSCGVTLSSGLCTSRQRDVIAPSAIGKD
jgi:predicted RNase H-like HicB family nuclease